MEAHELTLMQARGAVGAGEIAAEDLARACLERIEAVDDRLRAFLDVQSERAVERARAIDAARSAGEALGPLAGVPVALKDNICSRFGTTTCASRMLEHYRSPFDATVVERLEKAGAVIVGKTNLDEFAMGSSTEHSHFGSTRNPWDESRVPGGSSGGSAAAVAARLVPGALGSDTGGSIRQPGALCGCVGFKPTYGRVPRWGLVAFASSLDQIGPLARSVEDAALLAHVISGLEERDSTSLDAPPIGMPDGSSGDSLAGTRIAIPAEARDARNSPSVNEALDRAAAVLENLGAVIVSDAALPNVPHAIDAYYIIAPAEASSNLARYDGIRYGYRAEIGPDEGLEALYERTRGEGFGAEVKRRIVLGTYVLSAGYYDAYYRSALKVRRLVARDFEALLSGEGGCDAVLTPATAGPAFEIGSKVDDPLAMYLEDIYTVPANLAGLPSISLPVMTTGECGAPLPVGVLLTGIAMDDERLLRIASALESAIGFDVCPPV